MLIQKINLENSWLIGSYNNLLFIFEYFHGEQYTSGAASSSSSSSSSSDRLVQICMTYDPFHTKTAAFSTEQCTSPSLFSRFEVSRGGSNCSLKNYSFFATPFFSSRVRMRTNHLATKCNYYARSLNIAPCVLCYGHSHDQFQFQFLFREQQC